MASCSLAGSEDSPDYHSQTLDLINGKYLVQEVVSKLAFLFCTSSQVQYLSFEIPTSLA